MLKSVSVFFIFYFILTSANGFSQDLDSFRIQYEKAVEDKAICKTLIQKLRLKQERKEIKSVELAYLGALETIWANHVLNPLSKLKTFKKGKEKIETAIRQNSNDIEIYYLRLSVQKNAPSFLGYNSNIKEDSDFVKKHRHLVTSMILQKHIASVLKD